MRYMKEGHNERKKWEQKKIRGKNRKKIGRKGLLTKENEDAGGRKKGYGYRRNVV